MRKSLWTIFTVLLLAIGASIARADSPSFDTVKLECTDACGSLLAAPDTSFSSPAVEATSAGYDFSSPFTSSSATTNQNVLETRSVEPGISMPPTALAAYGQVALADCKPKPCPTITPVPEPSSGILALSGIGLVFLLGNCRRAHTRIST
jgi:hypothetical protein